MGTTPAEIEKLQSYYEINLSHARWSFWASLASVIVGLLALLAGIFALIVNGQTEAGTITIVAGVLSEFISATFFFLYNKNLQQLKFFYEKLIKFQDTYWALGLLNTLTGEKKDKMTEIIVSNLIMRNEPKSDLTPEQIKAYIEMMKMKE